MLQSDFCDNETEAIIDLNVICGAGKHITDKCLIIFSKEIHTYLLEHYACEIIGEIGVCNGNITIYCLEYKGEKIAFYLTGIGSAVASAMCCESHYVIFTYMWAFDMQSDWDYIKSVTDKFEATGGNVYCVELVADRAVRIERNKTENRLKNKASKRDIVVSEDRMLREETKYRLVSNDGEIPFENYMKIDNTNLEPSEVALMIKERFNLQGIGVTELMNRVKLEEVREDEIEQLYDMQIQSFMPLYEKYHDDMSPAIEPIERVKARATQENRKYYFIVKDGAKVGAINVGKRFSDPEEECLYISPLFILPKYQNQGIGYVAIQKVFYLYPDAKAWKLDTILQEPGNCHLYEKCGFVRVGEEHIINDKMTLIDYEKR